MPTTMVTIRVPDDELARINEGARRLGTSRSRLMIEAALARLAEPEDRAGGAAQATPVLDGTAEGATPSPPPARPLPSTRSVDVTPFFKNLKKPK